jgi:hypothetical protein
MGRAGRLDQTTQVRGASRTVHVGACNRTMLQHCCWTRLWVFPLFRVYTHVFMCLRTHLLKLSEGWVWPFSAEWRGWACFLSLSCLDELMDSDSETDRFRYVQALKFWLSQRLSVTLACDSESLAPAVSLRVSAEAPSVTVASRSESRQWQLTGESRLSL